MSVMRRVEQPYPHTSHPQRLDDVYTVTEAFRSIAVAWESIAAGAWSTAAIQSFAALARRVTLELSTLGCGALDSAVVDLVLALDAITVSGSISKQQLARVDQALATIRAVAVQRLMALSLNDTSYNGEYSPVMFHEVCPRCAASGICAITRQASFSVNELHLAAD
ncbi:MAG: hypothetical protein AB4911_01520 [Oscillochloridaceae bacterium umkhey_bin13]